MFNRKDLSFSLNNVGLNSLYKVRAFFKFFSVFCDSNLVCNHSNVLIGDGFRLLM
jgi:hypothetical protein